MVIEDLGGHNSRDATKPFTFPTYYIAVWTFTLYRHLLAEARR